MLKRCAPFVLYLSAFELKGSSCHPTSWMASIRRARETYLPIDSNTNSSWVSLSTCTSSSLRFFNCKLLVQSASVPIIACSLRSNQGRGHHTSFWSGIYGRCSLRNQWGNIGARNDTEVARIGLSANEIGPKDTCHISHHTSRRTKWSCIQGYYTIQKGNPFGFL